MKKVMIYGDFNVIHAGHIRYINYAKQFAGVLIVALNENTKKNQNNFNIEERLIALNELKQVDKIVIVKDNNLNNVVLDEMPDLLVLGKEFEHERHNEIKNTVKTLKKLNINIIYHAGEYVHNYQINEGYDEGELSKERKKINEIIIKNKVNINNILNQIKKNRHKNILTIGDSIVDRYVSCNPIGMSSEAPVIVVKENDHKDFIGGAAIVAAHIAALGFESTFISVIGDDKVGAYLERELENKDVQTILFKDDSRPTTLKTRFMVDNHKIFRLSKLNEHDINTNIEKQIIINLESHLVMKKTDCIIVSDFVYGVITKTLLKKIKLIAKKHNIALVGDLQCSSQVGDVRKFENFELISPTEKEARIAMNNSNAGIETVANKLLEVTNVNKLILKLGAEGFLIYEKNNNKIEKNYFPALSSNPLDVTGAGDSLLSMVTVALASGLSFVEASILGACMAALSVSKIGNQPIKLVELEKFINLNILKEELL